MFVCNRLKKTHLLKMSFLLLSLEQNQWYITTKDVVKSNGELLTLKYVSLGINVIQQAFCFTNTVSEFCLFCRLNALGFCWRLTSSFGQKQMRITSGKVKDLTLSFHFLLVSLFRWIFVMFFVVLAFFLTLLFFSSA